MAFAVINAFALSRHTALYYSGMDCLTSLNEPPLDWLKWLVMRVTIDCFGSFYLSGKLPTYPSSKQTLILTSQLRPKVGLH